MTTSSSTNPVGFGAACIEIFFALLRGLARLATYNDYANSPWQLEYVRLQSAIDHLRRGVALNVLGESYLERVNRAPPEMLAKVLAEFGFTMSDVEHWRKKPLPEGSAEAATPTKEAA